MFLTCACKAKYFAAFVVVFSIVTNSLGEVVFNETLIEDSFAGASHTCFADINGDGNLDIVACAVYANEIRCWINDGNGNFDEEYLIAENFGVARTVAAADLDGDGNCDVLGASFGDNELTWWENDGHYGFTEHVISSEMIGAHTVVAIDMDDDQDIDIVLGSWNYGVTVWENDGNAGFTLAYFSDVSITSSSVAVKDMDDDNDLDIVSVDNTEDTIELFRNMGNYTFELSSVATDFDGSHWCDVADFDNDGDMDVVGVAEIAGSLRWYENDGEEIFTTHTIEAIAGAIWVGSADFDNDGDIDILAIGEIVNQILWYENDGSGDFEEHLIKDNFDRVIGASIVDVDGDGEMDFSAAAIDAGEVIYFQNLRNNAYASSSTAIPLFAVQDQEITITSEIQNPENFTIEVFADINDGSGDEIVAVEMFDDGAHGDGAEDDGVWGISWAVPTGEFMYDVDIRAIITGTGATSTNTAPCWFTSIGPVSINNVVVSSANTPLAPGDMAIIQVELLNSANTATVTELSAVPLTTDENVTILQPMVYDFPDIAAGETGLPENHYIFTVSADCPDIYEIPVDLSIQIRGEEVWTTSFNVSVGSADVDEELDQMPEHYSLDLCYPNPFNPTLNVGVSLPETSDLKVMIYNVMGQNVATLADRSYSVGTHNFVFNANEVTSHSSGVYFVHASVAGKLNQVKKVILMK